MRIAPLGGVKSNLVKYKNKPATKDTAVSRRQNTQKECDGRGRRRQWRDSQCDSSEFRLTGRKKLLECLYLKKEGGKMRKM